MRVYFARSGSERQRGFRFEGSGNTILTDSLISTLIYARESVFKVSEPSKLCAATFEGK